MKPEQCIGCPAYNAPGPVWHDAGGYELRLAIFGEAPGPDEVAAHKPFIGAAGGLLWQLARSVGLYRNETYVSNIAKCITKDPAAFKHCWKAYGQKEVDALPPDLPILALGNFAKDTLAPVLAGWGITVCRGTRIGRVTVALHPSFIRRTAQSQNETTAMEDKQDLTPTLAYDMETALTHKPPTPIQPIETVNADRILKDTAS